MRELLGQSLPSAAANTDSGHDLQIIACRISAERVDAVSKTTNIGLLVDAVEGTEEVLVRTLGRHAGRWYGVAGATELRDGTVALVLDCRDCSKDQNRMIGWGAVVPAKNSSNTSYRSYCYPF